MISGDRDENMNIYFGIFLLIFGSTMFFISLYSFRHKDIVGKNAFALMCLCAAVYSLGYAMELNSGSFDRIMFWNYFQYAGLPLIPAFWLIFALQYCGKGHILTPGVYVLVFIFPAVTMAMRFTNDMHHLFYAKVYLYNNGLFNLIDIQKGFWYYVNFVYASLAEILSSFLYWRLFFKTNSKIRSHTLIMFLASVFPWMSTVVITLFRTPYGIDIGPFTIAMSSVFFLLGFFKYNFLNLKPIARDKVFEWSDDGIIILDSRYIIIDFNLSASKIINALCRESIGQDIRDHLKGYEELLNSIANSNEAQLRMQRGENSCYYSVKCLEIFDKRGGIIGYLVYLHDITAHVNTLEKLNYIACTDELTGILNRRHFAKLSENELSRAKRYNHPLSFIILDIDFFKEVNDRFGHLAGDEVLKNISRICRKTIRASDLLGRFGGEEFIILMPETHIEDAVSLAGRICKNIESSKILYNGQSINVTVSLGVTGTDSVKDQDLNAFFKLADQALYNAKACGRNCVREVDL